LISVLPEALAAIDQQQDRQVRAWARLELYTSPVVSAVYIEKTSLEGSVIVQEIYGTSRRSISVNPSPLYSPLVPGYTFTQGRGLFDRVDDFPFGGVARLFGFPGAMPLDGSYAVFDDMEAAGVGLWFRDNSPKHYGYSVAIEFAEAVDVNALTIVYDRLTQEYGTTLIWLSDLGETELGGGTYGGAVETVAEIAATGVGRINLRPVDWMGDEYEYTRISEVYFGRIKLFGPDDIISMEVTEPISPLTDDLPAPEIRLTVADPTGEFNPLDLSGTAWLLERDMSIVAQWIVDGHHISAGSMGLYEWDTSTRGQVTFTARPRLFLMTGNYTSPSPSNDTLDDVLTDIFSFLPGLSYTVDTSIASVTIGQMADGIPYPQAIQQAVTAAGGYVHIARDGTVQCRAIGLDTDPIYTYALDNARDWPKPVQNRNIKMAVVHWYPKTLAASTTAISASVINATTIDGRVTSTRVYHPERAFMGDLSLSISGTGAVSGRGSYSRIIGAGAQTLSGTGKKTTVKNYALEVPGDGNNTDEEREINNPFVQDDDRALAVGELVVDYARRRLELRLNDRGAVHVEPGDVVTVETEFGDLDMLVTEQNLIFANDFLRGQAVGVVRVGA